MPRKKTKSLQRDIPADRVYGSVLVQKLINKTMLDGKKQLAEKIVYQAMEAAAKQLKQEDALVVLETAIKNVTPQLEVKSRRVGGANYQIPFEVKGARQTHLTLMWFVAAVRARRKTASKSSAQVMALEIVDAFNNSGMAVKKREDTHKMAEANRAFAHFARY